MLRRKCACPLLKLWNLTAYWCSTVLRVLDGARCPPGARSGSRGVWGEWKLPREQKPAGSLQSSLLRLGLAEGAVPTRVMRVSVKGTETVKTLCCRKVVKPPKASIFFQAADSDGNINLKIWRVYPLQFAILEVGSITKEARPETRLAPFLLESGF
jgi:hypothetical protein